ncbi:hypothetical protein ACGFYY_30505 [Streptomyces sp. NPDC048331]|uniref:hypothetical protein n=1 Tax=Streptomyces sp. NPDC048331 TaxID=3365534 RepID=UPI0037141135
MHVAIAEGGARGVMCDPRTGTGEGRLAETGRAVLDLGPGKPEGPAVPEQAKSVTSAPAVGRMATRAAVGAALCPSLVRSVTGSPSGKERAERKISSMERQLTQFGTPVQYAPRLAGWLAG